MILIDFLCHYQYIFIENCACSYTGITVHTIAHTYYSLFLLNLMLPAFRPSFTDVAGTTFRVEQACPRERT